LLSNALLACIVGITAVGGGKILALLEVEALLLLLPLAVDAFNGLLSVLVDPWVACISIIICLPDVVESSMRLLGISRGELVEQMI
jgi:hypothetical protein